MHLLLATATSPSSEGSSLTCHRPYLSTRPASGMHALGSAQRMTLLPAIIHRKIRSPLEGYGIIQMAIPLPRQTRMPHRGGEPTQIPAHPVYCGIKSPYITTSGRPDITVLVRHILVPIASVFITCLSAAVVPLTVLSSDTVGTGRDSTDVPFHPKYEGIVLFKNKFDGQLPATDYPKVNFYLAMLLAYVLFASAWGWLCYKHVQDLLPIQVGRIHRTASRKCL
jgi:hypothetical protein